MESLTTRINELNSERGEIRKAIYEAQEELDSIGHEIVYLLQKITTCTDKIKELENKVDDYVVKEYNATILKVPNNLTGKYMASKALRTFIENVPIPSPNLDKDEDVHIMIVPNRELVLDDLKYINAKDSIDKLRDQRNDCRNRVSTLRANRYKIEQGVKRCMDKIETLDREIRELRRRRKRSIESTSEFDLFIGYQDDEYIINKIVSNGSIKGIIL